jgi:hypothetical protein
MKAQTLNILGILMFSSGVALAQVNNNIIINSDTTRTNTKTDTVRVVEVDTVKEVRIVEVPKEEPKITKEEPPFKSGEIGVRFMPTFSTFKVMNPDGRVAQAELAVSYGYGGMLAVNSKHVGLQLEVIYSEISQKYKDQDLERKIDINYLNIPLLLTLNTDKSKPVNFGVAFGPQVGINIGSRVSTKGGSSDTDTLQATVALKKGDFGFAYGAGFDFALNPKRTVKLNLGFRGVYGLIDISDNKTRATNSYYILGRTNVETYSGYLGLSFVF